MKRFPELARRGVALALAASMSLSVFMPGALAVNAPAADDHDHVHLAAENSVDALGNEDLSDETYHEPDDRGLAADAADHTWGEWLEGEYEDGSTVRFRICEDGDAVQFEDGNIMIPEGGSADRTLDDFVTSDQPEWLEQGMLMGTDAYAIQTAADRAKVDQKWNYEADHSKWTIDRSTTYYHGYDGMGNDHGKYGLMIVQRSIKNGTMRRIIPNGRSTEARPITMVMMAWVMTMVNMDLMCGQVKARTRNKL